MTQGALLKKAKHYGTLTVPTPMFANKAARITAWKNDVKVFPLDQEDYPITLDLNVDPGKWLAQSIRKQSAKTLKSPRKIVDNHKNYSPVYCWKIKTANLTKLEFRTMTSYTPMY